MPFMYRRIPQEQPTPGEWQTDEHGRKYREIAPGHREYEMMISVSGGLEIPESELENYHRRQREAEEARRKQELEKFQKTTPPKNCPFDTGCNNQCRRDKCALYVNNQCAIAIIADAQGVEVEQPATGKKCPFSIYGHCDKCELNPRGKGCAIVRIAAAQNKNK